MNFQIIRYDQLGSTNTEALNQAHGRAAEGLCIIANRQTQGRGREGRLWNSEEGRGLYFSILLRPKITARYVPILTLLSAVAVHDTLKHACGIDSDIKWPNDLLVSEKKICGILAETCETSDGLAVVVGIGINYVSEGLPKGLSETATSVLDVTGVEADADLIIRSLTHFFGLHYRQFNDSSNAAQVLREWSARSSYVNGKEVRVTTRNGVLTGVTCGIDQFGALLVKCSDGRIASVTAGDVESVRSKETEVIEESDSPEDVKTDEMCENV